MRNNHPSPHIHIVGVSEYIVNWESFHHCLSSMYAFEMNQFGQFVTTFSVVLFTISCVTGEWNSSGVLTNCTHDDGQEKKIVNGWAMCHNGHYVMTACQGDDGSRVDIGLTVRQRGFVFRCDQSTDTSLTLHPVACIRQKNKGDAVVVEAGQRTRDPPFLYECVRVLSWDPNANSLALKAVACTTDTSDIPDGGTVTLGDFTYNCSRASGSLTNTVREVFLQAKGCIYQGKEYALEERAIIGNFVFKCRSSGGWPSALEFAIIGCAYDRRRYEENEKYYTTRTNSSSYRYIMQCRHNDNTWSSVPVGCVQEGNPLVERSVGETWTDNGGPGDPRLKYIMQCRGVGTSLGAITTQCIYQPNVNDPSTMVTIGPGGCMKKFTKPNALVKCIKGQDPSDGVSSEVILKLNINKAEQDALAAGFKYC